MPPLCSPSFFFLGCSHTRNDYSLFVSRKEKKKTLSPFLAREVVFLNSLQTQRAIHESLGRNARLCNLFFFLCCDRYSEGYRIERNESVVCAFNDVHCSLVRSTSLVVQTIPSEWYLTKCIFRRSVRNSINTNWNEENFRVQSCSINRLWWWRTNRIREWSTEQQALVLVQDVVELAVATILFLSAAVDLRVFPLSYSKYLSPRFSLLEIRDTFWRRNKLDRIDVSSRDS